MNSICVCSSSEGFPLTSVDLISRLLLELQLSESDNNQITCQLPSPEMEGNKKGAQKTECTGNILWSVKV